MRKQTLGLVGAIALLALLQREPLLAQTTFALSNDHTATLRVEQLDATGTIVTIVRAARTSELVPISTDVVLRDPATGIAHRALSSATHMSKDGLLESTSLRFPAFDADVANFDLLDIERHHQHLYFSQIRVGAHAAQADQLSSALGTGTR